MAQADARRPGKEKEARAPARLFDQVLVVGVSIESGKARPSVRLQFPPGPEQAALAMAQFCLPDLDVLQPAAEREPEKFSFVLTESDGSRRFGLVLRHLPPPPPAERHPVCFCVVSTLPCYAMFDQLLGVLEAKWALSSAAVTRFLEAVRDAPVPPPGGSCVVRAPSTRGAHIEQYRLARPAEGEHMLEHLDFAELFRAAAAASLVAIFASLLCERRCVFVSHSLAVLSNFVQAVMALLHPLSWQYIYIPVLPKALLSFVCAPMPFVVGVLAAHLPEVRRLGPAMDEVLLFDIDADRFLARPFDDRKLLPPALLAPLAADAERFVKSARKKKERREPAAVRRDVSDAFVSFFIDLLGAYAAHLRADADGAVSFDRDAMLAAAPDAHRELLGHVLATQMFDCFIREREEAAAAARRGKPAAPPLGPFEQRVYMLAQMERALARAPPAEADALRDAMASVRRPRPPKKSKMAVLSALVGQATTSLPLPALDLSSSSASSPAVQAPVISRPMPAHADDAPPALAPSPGRSPSPQPGAPLRHPSPRHDEPLSPRRAAPAPGAPAAVSAPPSSAAAASAKGRARGQRQAMVLNERALENADDDVFALLARKPAIAPAPAALAAPAPAPAAPAVPAQADAPDEWTAANAPPRSPRPAGAPPTAPLLSASRSSRGGTVAPAAPAPATDAAGVAAVLASLTREEVECWSVEDTVKWAADIGHAPAAAALRAHAVDGAALLDLDARDLDELALAPAAATALLRYLDHWRRRRT